jgi:uncharacterized protein YifN (PemK superfamily)
MLDGKKHHMSVTIQNFVISSTPMLGTAGIIIPISTTRHIDAHDPTIRIPTTTGGDQ